MPYTDLLRITVFLTGAEATALGAITALGANRAGDSTAILVAAGWWLVSLAIGLYLGRPSRAADDQNSVGRAGYRAADVEAVKQHLPGGNGRQRQSRGLGMALSIVRRLCNLLGHPLELHSTPGRGSVFRVVVPAERWWCSSRSATTRSPATRQQMHPAGSTTTFSLACRTSAWSTGMSPHSFTITAVSA